MTMTSTAPTITYTATAAQTAFTIPFRWFADADIRVTIDNVAKTLTTDFTLSGEGDVNGGTMTLVVAATGGEEVVVARESEIVRSTDFQTSGDFLADTVNEEFDRLTAFMQETEAYALKIDRESDSTPAGLKADATDRAGTALGFDSNGDLATVSLGTDDDPSLRTDLASTGATPGASLVGIRDVAGNFTGTEVETALTEVPTLTGSKTMSGDMTFSGDNTHSGTDIHTGTKTFSGTLNATGTLATSNHSNVDTTLTGMFKALDKRNWPRVSVDTDAAHDILVSAGTIMDSTSTEIITTTAMTKQIDATWAAGDDAGGMFTGSVAADTTYHFFVIVKDSDGSVDAGFDTSVSAANIPAGYTAYRRIFSIYTDSSSDITPFYQAQSDPDKFMLETAAESHNVAASTTAALFTADVPSGLKIMADIQHGGNIGSNNSFEGLVSSPQAADNVVDATNQTVDVVRTSTYYRQQPSRFEVETDTSAQLRIRSSANNGTQVVITHGWRDGRVD